MKTLKEPLNSKEETLVADFKLACERAKKISTNQIHELITVSLGVTSKETINKYMKRLEQMGYISHDQGILWKINS